MLISKTVMLIWRINITINIADIVIIGTLSNFAYLILLIIASDTITLSVNTRYGLNNPLRYNVAKINENILSPIEIAIKESKIKSKNREEMDSEMLKDIEKTTIVKLSNKKSYKISPVRKKENKVKQMIYDDIELL